MMKTKFKNLICLMGLFGFVVSAVPVLAQPFGPGSKDPEVMRERMEARMSRMQERLNLSEVQAELLKTHRIKHREQMREYQESTKAKRDEIRVELEQQDLKMEKITKLHSELKELLVRKADLRLEGILEVRQILTPEQFQEFMEMKGKNRPRGPKGMHHGSPDCPDE